MTKERLNGQLLGSINNNVGQKMSLEIKKSKLGAALVAVNAIGIAELSQNKVIILSHAGRVEVTGDGLTLSVFEDKSVEILGRIKGVELDYGKFN